MRRTMTGSPFMSWVSIEVAGAPRAGPSSSSSKAPVAPIRMCSVPICLASQLHVRRPVERGQLLTMDDVDLPETEALAAWQAIERRVLRAPRRPRHQARAS